MDHRLAVGLDGRGSCQRRCELLYDQQRVVDGDGKLLLGGPCQQLVERLRGHIVPGDVGDAALGPHEALRTTLLACRIHASWFDAAMSAVSAARSRLAWSNGAATRSA